nr:piggyBac transposable element-derived protein 3-like [Lepeophtheirus salmonis]
MSKRNISIKVDVCGICQTDIMALLDAVDSEDEEDLDNLVGDYDNEFEYVDEADQNTIEYESSKKTIENEDEYSLDAVVKSKFNHHDCHLLEQVQFDFNREVKGMSVSEFVIWFLNLHELFRLIVKENALNRKVFPGIILGMNLMVLPSIKDYWRTDQFGVDWIQTTMPRDKLLEILRILHFPNNHVKTNDKAWKVRPLLDHWNKIYQRYAQKSKFQPIDDHMTKYKGHHGMRKYLKYKPIKWGFKNWLRCDAKQGYCYEFDLYQGKTEGTSSEFGLGGDVVLSLTSSLKFTYARVFTDNYFSSVNLVQQLKERGIYYNGTIQKKRKGLPEFIPDKELRKTTGSMDAFVNVNVGVGVL